MRVGITWLDTQGFLEGGYRTVEVTIGFQFSPQVVVGIRIANLAAADCTFKATLGLIALTNQR
jgi:hypothetical protein